MKCPEYIEGLLLEHPGLSPVFDSAGNIVGIEYPPILPGETTFYRFKFTGFQAFDGGKEIRFPFAYEGEDGA